jgi:hypothetical protein
MKNATKSKPADFVCLNVASGSVYAKRNGSVFEVVDRQGTRTTVSINGQSTDFYGDEVQPVAVRLLDLAEVQKPEGIGAGFGRCLICGKKTAFAVHLLTTGNLVNSDASFDDQTDQGFFDVGSECARRLGEFAFPAKVQE